MKNTNKTKTQRKRKIESLQNIANVYFDVETTPIKKDNIKERQ